MICILIIIYIFINNMHIIGELYESEHIKKQIL